MSLPSLRADRVRRSRCQYFRRYSPLTVCAHGTCISLSTCHGKSSSAGSPTMQSPPKRSAYSTTPWTSAIFGAHIGSSSISLSYSSPLSEGFSPEERHLDRPVVTSTFTEPRRSFTNPSHRYEAFKRLTTMASTMPDASASNGPSCGCLSPCFRQIAF